MGSDIGHLDIVDEGLHALHLVVRPPGDAQLRAVLLQDGEATLSSRIACMIDM